jgi:wobble nucleotide-excising tRNase
MPALTDSELYEEFHKTAALHSDTLSDTSIELNKTFKLWLDALTKKLQDPFNSEITIEPLSTEKTNIYNNTIRDINNTIKAHNCKSSSFEDQVKKAKRKLELHYLTEELSDSNYFKTKEEIILNSTKIATEDIELSKLTKIVSVLESALSNEAIGATQFNALLHNFLGRDQITLEFDSAKKGYSIMRTPENIPAKNLSEGEKNAIGLIYFITKLLENDRDIKETIIAIDDPVSSFDSNNTFNAHAFVRHHCQEAKQLFLLTHNFNYFKLARDWLAPKNKVKSNIEIIKSRFYCIEASPTNPRISYVKNAPQTLLNHNSEYHFLFESLTHYIDRPELDINESYAVANLARKLLEAFLTFKYPQGRGNFRELMTLSIGDNSTCELIYRFINKYSHNQLIEFDDSHTDNVTAESTYIVKLILNEIERIDKTHFDGMKIAIAL